MSKQFNWQVAGHKNIVNFLQSAISRNKLSHAYLFFGDQYLGKKNIAKYFAQSILCDKKQAQIPCGQCASCRQFINSTHPDFLVIKRVFDKKTEKNKQNISVEQIRELKNKISLSSFLKNYKVIIIEDAETLSAGATDALLKTLEEPSKKTVFILITSYLDVLPATIASRCQKIKFLPLSFSEIYDYLVSKKINRSLSLDLSSISMGKPELADYYLHEDNLKTYYKNLENNLNLISQPHFNRFGFVDSLLEKQTVDQQRELAMSFLIEWENIIRGLLLFKNISDEKFSNLKVVNNKFIDVLKKTKMLYNNKSLVSLLDYINKSKKYLNNNINPRLILENFLLKI